MNGTSKNTHELVLGDIVWCHGARVLIDSEIKTSSSHPASERGGPCLYTHGLVIHQDDETDTLFSRFVAVDQGRWIIQGNGLATWWVEVQA